MTDEKIAEKKSKAHTQYYNKNGEHVPGVTTILDVMAKPALVPWANRMGLNGTDTNGYVSYLAKIGTFAHAMVHHHLGGEIPKYEEYSPEDITLAENSFKKYLNWENKNPFEIIGTEMKLVSQKYQYGGTCDLVVKMNGKLKLIDIKTSKAIYDNHFTQVAGYGIALKENGYDIQDYMILRIGRNEDEGFDCLSVPCMSLHEKRFICCRRLYWYNEKIKENS